jgi:hypothetical protein
VTPGTNLGAAVLSPSFTRGDPRNPLTFIAKYYEEFEAKNTFEGRSFDIAETFKF